MPGSLSDGHCLSLTNGASEELLLLLLLLFTVSGRLSLGMKGKVLECFSLMGDDTERRKEVEALQADEELITGSS